MKTQTLALLALSFFATGCAGSGFFEAEDYDRTEIVESSAIPESVVTVEEATRIARRRCGPISDR